MQKVKCTARSKRSDDHRLCDAVCPKTGLKVPWTPSDAYQKSLVYAWNPKYEPRIEQLKMVQNQKLLGDPAEKLWLTIIQLFYLNRRLKR
jgi:hypothetical protein